MRFAVFQRLVYMMHMYKIPLWYAAYSPTEKRYVFIKTNSATGEQNKSIKDDHLFMNAN